MSRILSLWFKSTDSPMSDAFTEAPPMSMVPQNQDSALGHVHAHAHATVAPETVFNMGTYEFNFDPVPDLIPSQVVDTHHLSSPQALPDQQGIFHQFSHPQQQSQQHPHHHNRVFGDTWDATQLSLASLPHSYNISPAPSHTHSVSSLTVPQTTSPLLPPGGRSDYHSKALKARTSRSRSRQISLRQQPVDFPLQDFGNKDSVPFSWMAQLAEVNSRLMELSSALPSHQDVCTMARPADDHFKVDGFPIDEMFKLTRVIADILDGVITVNTASSPANVAETAQARLECADPANSMFFLSIYMRLLDMYQRVFGLVQRELGQAESQAGFRFWKLPDVTVGSFAVDSTPSLQMNLTVQLAEEFLSRLRGATAVLDPCRPTSGSSQQENDEGISVFSGVVDGSYQAVRSKEDNLRKHLSELRAEIEALLDS
ncbi:hypothetical protein N3K66_001102 [Trichothecium roseum]|uniref:Uncharacterized protein n=1 Tax=Trichothecium roseum TaxID=47278 RepID=A0ACC0VEN5_9HYPO|nr:hypothetical protein N3K66_001102 [Trichothecium roseum]